MTILISIDEQHDARQRQSLPCLARAIVNDPSGGFAFRPAVRDPVSDKAKTLAEAQNCSFSGPVNAVAPEAVTMKEFCKTLGRVLRRPVLATIPAFALRAALGEMADMLLTGQKVVAGKLMQSGYPFRFRRVSDALANALK